MKETRDRNLLRTILVEIPHEYQLKKICWDLEIDFNELEGNNPAEKGASLFDLMRHAGRLPDLDRILRKRYPRRFDDGQETLAGNPGFSSGGQQALKEKLESLLRNSLKWFISTLRRIGSWLSPLLSKLIPLVKRRLLLIVVVVIISISCGSLLSIYNQHPDTTHVLIKPQELLPDPNDHTGICVTIRCAFYFGGVNAVYKQDAVVAAQRNNGTDAATYLQWAIDTDITDAEAKILQVNMDILKNPQHITAAVAITLTCIDPQPTPEDRLEINAGLDTLQGAYIVQQLYNEAHPDRQLVLEIVNLGSISTIQESGSQQRLSQFLINEANKNADSFLGVIGLPFNLANTFVDTLSSAGIPMISLAPQTNIGVTNYLVSIVPSLREIADDIASYIKTISPTAYIVYNKDASASYDSQMSTFLSEAFTNSNGFTMYSLPYSETTSQSDLTSDAEQINTEEKTASLKYPVVFIGSPEDAVQFYPQLQDKTLPIFGDDSFFDYVRLPESVKKQLDGIKFFAFAYEDQWQAEGFSLQPLIDRLYIKEYDPGNKRRGSYSFERTSDTVLLAYDALSLLAFAGDGANPLPGCQNSQGSCTFTSQKCILKPQGKSLREQQWEFIHDCTFVGGSGEINLTLSDSSPVNKELLILQIQWYQAQYGEVTHTFCQFGQFAQNTGACVEKRGACQLCQ